MIGASEPRLDALTKEAQRPRQEIISQSAEPWPKAALCGAEKFARGRFSGHFSFIGSGRRPQGEVDRLGRTTYSTFGGFSGAPLRYSASASRKKLRLADLRLLCDLCRCFAIWLFGYLKYAARWRAERPAKKKPRYQGGGAQ